ILPQEREVFLKLNNDRERDLFIETFWKVRDPTPGTPENEFREEHIRRFNYANKYLRRGSPREGWMTDMGKFYILLGPPVSIERFEGVKGIYPTQVWYYYGDKEKGLPPHFALVFYKKGEVGEYKLYDPAVDGPASLMVEGKRLDPMDYETLYEKLREMAPTLALVSLSMIPGEIPYGYQPSTRNNIIISKILEAPKRGINPSYATHFLRFKGVVTTDYLTNYVESDGYTALITDPVLGLNFVHFSIAPKKISIDYYEPKDKYFCNFKVNVSLRKKDKIIFQYTKNYPFYFSPEIIEKVKANGLSIEDSFPIIEGNYKLTILLQNSVGKEFSVYETDVNLPENAPHPRICGLILGYKTEYYDVNNHLPFKIVNKKLLIDPKNIFSNKEEIVFFIGISNINKKLWERGRVEISIKGTKSIKTLLFKLKNYPYNRTLLSLIETIPSNKLVPDLYEMTVYLFEEDKKMIDKRKTTFIISPAEIIGHPIVKIKNFPLSSKFLMYLMLADQYAKIGAVNNAMVNYEKAYKLNPNYKKGVIRYGYFLVKNKKYDRALEIIENLKEDEKYRFDYFLIKGLALAGKGKYSEAINNLLEGNKIYNSDIRLLNALGFCYFKTGQLKEALNVLKASLSLNPKQEKIKKLVKEIKETK
ncbi:GWxTD domain-containing protein, partial [Candidatus Aminicenantes bacterium AC-335-G13]|nr:GWxTD domain-containing protein [Candidatus Aminicenantes bacterium AC-335-G13]